MATITLYKTGLTRAKNACVDNIEYFLNSRIVGSISEVQYQKFALEMRIKLNLPAGFANIGRVDYASLSNDDHTGVRYFFVDRPEVLSQNTVLFNLHMDTVNSFQGIPFTGKTFIGREHRDRFKPEGYTPTRAYIRKIDNHSEGDVPQKFFSTKEKIESPSGDWTTVYSSNTSVTGDSKEAITCSFYPHNEMYANIQSSKITIDTSNKHSYGLIFGFTSSGPTPYNINGTSSYKDSITFEDDNGNTATLSLGQFPPFYDSTGPADRALIYHSGDDFITFYYLGYYQLITWNKKYNIGFTPKRFTINASKYYYNSGATADLSSTWTANSTSGRNIPITTASFINNADSKLVKIIDFPYPSFDFDISPSSLYLTINQEGVYINDDGIIYTDNPGISNEVEIGTLRFADYVRKIIPGGIDGTEPRDDAYESKMYSSPFFSLSLVYDSFIKNIDLERLDITTALETSIPLKFKATNTVNSKFIFKIDFDATPSLRYDMLEMFENYLVCDRNNEQTIYNNNYIDYLKTGYNYDKKANSLAIANTALSGVSSVASNIARGAMSGNYAGAIIGGASAIFQTVTSAIQQQNSFEQKQAEIRNRSASVSGSNDLDLLKYYSDNKAYICTYACSEEQRKNYCNLFYYCGYAVREMGIPNTYSRYWFNFLQCNAEFDTSNYGIEENVLNDIKQRFADGVTFFHEHAGQWDLEQVKENWESWLIQ